MTAVHIVSRLCVSPFVFYLATVCFLCIVLFCYTGYYSLYEVECMCRAEVVVVVVVEVVVVVVAAVRSLACFFVYSSCSRE